MSALQLELDYIPLYQLILGKDTFFGRIYLENYYSLPTEDDFTALKQQAFIFIKSTWLIQYEISVFVKIWHECKYNQFVWRGCDYLTFMFWSS